MLVKVSHSMYRTIEEVLTEFSRTLEADTADTTKLKLSAQADLIKGYLQTCREND